MTDTSDKDLDELLGMLSSKEVTERQHARAAIVKAGSAAVPQLLNALDAPQPHVRWEVAKSLAAIREPSAAERLVTALQDEDSDVRWVVGEALIALGHVAVDPVLGVLAKSELSEELKSGTHHVLHDLAKHSELATALEPVLKAFKEPEPGIAIPMAAAAARKNHSL